MHSKPTQTEAKLPTGIMRRHSRECASETTELTADGKRKIVKTGVPCNCKPSYRAWVFDRRTGVREYKTWSTLAAAKQWRADAVSQLGRGKRVTPSRQTLRDAAEAWLAGAKANPPTVKTRGGMRYKPSAIREYERDIRNYLLPEFGPQRLTDVGRSDLNAFVEKLSGRGLSDSKVRNIMLPLRVIYKREMRLGNANDNPTIGLELPNGHKSRERAATATEAAELLAPLPDDVRAIYATAFYGGLRRGELRGLRWDDVDLAGGIIRVSRSWDDVEGDITPKSEKGTRNVPIAALLRDHLAELKARTQRDGQDFVFGRERRLPFTPSPVRLRAAAAWATANAERAAKGLPALVPIKLHECRHTYVSLLSDAGLSLERIGDYVGHSSAHMTDRYRHLLAGHEAETARKLDEYLARADTASRLEQLDDPS